MKWFVIGFFIIGLAAIGYRVLLNRNSGLERCADREKNSLVLEYATRSILASKSPDPSLVDCAASSEEIREGISELIANDVRVVRLVRGLFSDKHELLKNDRDAAQADEILENIILPEIDENELLAKSGGRMDAGNNEEVMLGGAYFIEWARGMASYGVKGGDEPLQRWPEGVHLKRTGDNKIYLSDSDGHLITPGIRYI